MSDTTIFVGLDVPKQTIAVAVAPSSPSAACIYHGAFALPMSPRENARPQSPGLQEEGQGGDHPRVRTVT